MRKTLSVSEKLFLDRVQSLEKRIFPGQLDESDSYRMKNAGRYSWLYRPSHHIETGLITEEDVALLSVPGKRLLSVGAHPAYFEQLLCVLGIPADNIVVSDKDPAIALVEGLMDRTVFDATGIWPDIGLFDLIIFPESLCMAVQDNAKRSEDAPEGLFPTDANESQMLAVIFKQALTHLAPHGEIRANGPMSHPNVVKAACEQLTEEGFDHTINYARFFLTLSAKPAFQEKN